MNGLLMMMGGSGTRFGADRPKQFVLIDGKPLFSYLAKELSEVDSIDRFVFVSHADWTDYVDEWVGKYISKDRYQIVVGGKNRSQSVKNGLKSLQGYLKDEDVVLLHDVTHPYVDKVGIEKVISATNTYGGATLGSRSYDTVYRIDESGFLVCTEPRDLIYAGASPEAFKYGDILKIYINASEDELQRMTSAGAIALEYGIPMKVIETEKINLKITHKGDLERLYRLM